MNAVEEVSQTVTHQAKRWVSIVQTRASSSSAGLAGSKKHGALIWNGIHAVVVGIGEIEVWAVRPYQMQMQKVFEIGRGE